MLSFIPKVAGQWLRPSELPRYIDEVGENYPVIIKTFNGERSAISLKKLGEYKDGIREAWFPTERNWSLVEKHGMQKLEDIADSILSIWN
jgi:hypothetical protein